MTEITTQFRAALHGYNREDVVDFIDRMTQAHEEALDRLVKANAKLKEELDEANEALAAAKNNPESTKSLADAEELVEDLRNLNNDLSERNKRLQDELSRIRVEHDAETIPLLKAHEEARNRLQKEKAMLQMELDETKEALEAAKKNAGSDSAFTNVRATISELRHNNEQLAHRIKTLENELAEARANRREEPASVTPEHEEALELLKKENADLQEALAEAKEALAAAMENSEAKDTADAQTTIEELRSDKENLESQIQDLEETLMQLRTDRELEAATMARAHDEALASLQNANAALQDELAEAKEALSAAMENSDAKDTADAQTTIEELRSDKENLENQIQDLEKTLMQLRKDRELEAATMARAHDEALASLQNANAALQDELAEAKEALSAAAENAETKETEAMLEELRSDKDGLENQVHALKEELLQSRADWELEAASAAQAHEEERERLQNAYSALQEELFAAKEALAAAKADTGSDAAQTETVIADLQSDRENLERQILSLEDALEQARAERDAKEALLTQVQEQLAAAETNAKSAFADSEPSRDYAELELAAYRRAEQTERLARDRAKEVYRQVETVLGQANDNMSSCHEDLEQLCQEMQANVNEMLSVLTKIDGAYRQTKESIAEIGAKDRQLLEEKI
ncbi:MAG: hypothetical protein IIY94_03945 [Oscillospiraceae bacterium]|nr:hypothetical protein [Oscillospiraceae bacterium]